MSVEVADLVAYLGLDDQPFYRGMDSAERRMDQGASRIRAAMATIGFGAAEALGAMVHKAIDFQSATQQLANNTNMGAAGLARMRAGALKLADITGAPLDQLAAGFMQVANHAYSGAAAMNIATAAAKNAAATGGDASKDMGMLAGVMREYGVSVAQAAKDSGLATRYLDVLHNAVASSAWTMNQFVDGTKRAIATAGGLDVSLADVTSALAILSEHGFPNASNASTNLNGVMRVIASGGAKQAHGMLVQLGHAAGVNLVRDFTQAGLHTRGIIGVMQDLQKATGGNLVQLRQIFGVSSYAQAAMGLMRGMPEFVKAEQVTRAAQFGQHIKGLVGTNEAFAAWSDTVAGKMAKLRGTFADISVEVGSVFLPELNRLLGSVLPIVQGVTEWTRAHQKLAAGIMATVAGLGTFSGGLRAVEVLAGPLAGALGAISAPMLALGAAAGTAALAWQQNWGGIQQTVQGAWRAIQPWVRDLGTVLGATVGEVRQFGLGVGLRAGLSDFQFLFSRFTGWMAGEALPALRRQLTVWTVAFGEWVLPAIPVALGYLGQLKDRAVAWISDQVPVWTAQLDRWAVAITGWIRQETPVFVAALGAWAHVFGDVARRAWNMLKGPLGTFGSLIVDFLNSTSRTIETHTAAWAQSFADWLVAPDTTKTAQGLDGWVAGVETWIRSRGFQAMLRLGGALADAFVTGFVDVFHNLNERLWTSLSQIKIKVGNVDLIDPFNLEPALHNLHRLMGFEAPLGPPTAPAPQITFPRPLAAPEIKTALAALVPRLAPRMTPAPLVIGPPAEGKSGPTQIVNHVTVTIHGDAVTASGTGPHVEHLKRTVTAAMTGLAEQFELATRRASAGAPVSVVGGR